MTHLRQSTFVFGFTGFIRLKNLIKSGEPRLLFSKKQRGKTDNVAILLHQNYVHKYLFYIV